MTSSRSSKYLVVIAALFLWVGRADAGRKRVVVLEFSGSKAEKFHGDVVKLVKKSHTVISVEKWNRAAEELDAGKVTEKNVRKVARKLKIDGVITGRVGKRRGEYIIKLKLRSGSTGEVMGNSVQTKAEGPRLDTQAQRDIKDELIAVIDELEKNRGGNDEEVDTSDDSGSKKKSGFSRKDGEGLKSKSKKKKNNDEDEEGDEEVAESEPKEDEEPRARSKKRSKSADEDGGRRKRKASAEDEEEGVEEEVEVEEEDEDQALRVSPGHRAIDANLGLSFTARNLKFAFANDLGDPPPGYKQPIPVAGALVDVTFYPMAFGRKNKGIVTGLGINVLYDQIIKINSQKRYADGNGELQTANLETKENRFLVGAVLRYPLGKTAKAPVVGGSLSYSKQVFAVAQTLPNMESTDIPNVAYSMFTPAVFLRYPVIPKLTANLDLGFHAVTNTGAIQTRTQYGAATVSGFEFEAGADYMITKAIFARAGVRYQRFAFTFKGDPMSQTNTRDTDPEQDVTGAKDSYFGGTATIGYVY